MPQSNDVSAIGGYPEDSRHGYGYGAHLSTSERVAQQVIAEVTERYYKRHTRFLVVFLSLMAILILVL